MRAPKIFALALFSLISATLPAAETKPKLVVAIIVDQFRYDYLTRFRTDYHGGFDRLLKNGADYTNASYAQVPTVTAVGHSIFLSGAMPAVSGIVGNAWYDREAGQIVTSVCDWDATAVGTQQPRKGARCTDADPASPRRLLVSTLGDEMRLAHPSAKVVGVSLKARAAILPSGHAANAAFWFDDVSGNFISSTFYLEKLPEWAATYNHRKRADEFTRRKWDGFPSWNFQVSKDGNAPYAKLPASPWGNELVEEFAEAAFNGEQLGRRDETDLLTVSFSSNDYVGHAVGPYAPEVRDMSLRTDRLLAKLFDTIDSAIGMKNVLVVLSADHGVAPTPAQGEAVKLPGGYLAVDVEDTISNALNKEFGRQDWLIPEAGETSLYFNEDALKAAHRSDGSHPAVREIYDAARTALFAVSQLHIARVYSRDQLENGAGADFIAQAERNGYFPRRSGDLNIVFEPGWVPGTRGTTHFSPYNYDTHVPMLFMGPGIAAGRYAIPARPNDIAPTLARLLDVQTPSGSSGRVLVEMLGH